MPANGRWDLIWSLKFSDQCVSCTTYSALKDCMLIGTKLSGNLLPPFSDIRRICVFLTSLPCITVFAHVIYLELAYPSKRLLTFLLDYMAWHSAHSNFHGYWCENVISCN